jgi:putative flippase GtrA
MNGATIAGHFSSCVDAQHGQELMKYTARSEYLPIVSHEGKTEARFERAETRGARLNFGSIMRPKGRVGGILEKRRQVKAIADSGDNLENRTQVHLVTVVKGTSAPRAGNKGMYGDQPSNDLIGESVMDMIDNLTRHIPPGQFLRYIVVGAWNTIFGYGCFMLFTWFFIHLYPAKPVTMTSVAYVFAAFVNISVSFLGYKWFVFRTKGNYLLEYLRSFSVYLPTLAISAVAIAPLTVLLRRTTPFPQEAPYVAGAILLVITVVLSFLGHRHVSFRQKST